MIRYLQASILTTLALLVSGCATSVSPRATSAPAGDLRLPAPTNSTHRAYLELAPEVTTFEIADLRTGVLVIDCFDLYCPSCQKGARQVNELYGLVQERGLGERIKFLGLGLGNTPMEVATFRNKYGVEFPLFPDRSNAIARQFGEVHVPGLFVVCPDSPPRVIYRHFGIIRQPEKLLEELLEAVESACDSHEADVGMTVPIECGPELCPVPETGSGLGT